MKLGQVFGGKEYLLVTRYRQGLGSWASERIFSSESKVIFLGVACGQNEFLEGWPVAKTNFSMGGPTMVNL